jgi:hypothetical protein
MGRSAGRCQQIAASSPHISIEQELFDLPRPKGSLLSWRERVYQTVVPNAERTVTGFSGTAGG